jgi:hypothetical protein
MKMKDDIVHVYFVIQANAAEIGIPASQSGSRVCPLIPVSGWFWLASGLSFIPVSG